MKKKAQVPTEPQPITIAGYDSYEVTKGQAEFLLDDIDDNSWWLEKHDWDTQTTSGNLLDLWLRTEKYRKTYKGRVALLTKWTREYLNKDLDDLAFDAACDDGDIQQIAFEDCCYEIGQWLLNQDWHGETLYATVRGFGWRNLDGHATIECPSEYYSGQDGSRHFHCRKVGADFLRAILPDTDCSFTLYEEVDAKGQKYIRIKNYHHDSPTGASYYIYNKKQFAQQHFDIVEAAKAWDYKCWVDDGGFDAVDYPDCHKMSVAYQTTPDPDRCQRFFDELYEEMDGDLEEMEEVVETYRAEYDRRWEINIAETVEEGLKDLGRYFDAISRRLDRRIEEITAPYFTPAELNVFYLKTNITVSRELAAAL